MTCFRLPIIFRQLFTVVLCCVALSACGWIKDASVAMFGDKFFNEDDPRIQALTDFEPRLKLKEVWSISVGDAAKDAHSKLIPLVQGNVVFASDAEGRVSAFSVNKGNRLWGRSFKASISFGVGASGRILMVGTASGEVIAFSSNGKQQVWRKQFSDNEITAISRSHRGMVLVRDSIGSIIAVEIKSGNKLWELEIELPTLTLRGMSVPLLYKDFGFVGLDDGRLLAISLDNGRILREFRVGLAAQGTDLERIVDIDGQFQIYDGVLYVTPYRGRMLAFDIDAQNVLWLTEAESYGGLDVDEDFVYTVGTDGELRCLDRFNSKEIWSNPAFVVRDLSAPLAHGENIVVGDNLGYLYWLSRDDGSILARMRVSNTSIVSVPVAWRNHVITLDRNSNLTATKITTRLIARSKVK